MSTQPMMVQPVNPSDPGRGPMLIGLTWAFTGLAVISVALRLYVRRNLAHRLDSSDWTMLMAVIFQVVNQALVTVSYEYGLGKHDADLEIPDQLVNVLKWNWIASLPGMLVSILARISIAIMLVRLFGVHKWFKMFLIIFTTLQTIVCVIIIPLTWLQATPIEGLWNIFLPNVSRWDTRITLYAAYLGQSMYTFSDLTYVLLPVMIIWNLHMELHRRIGLVLLMSVSLFTMAMSIMKTLVAQGSSKDTVDVQYNASLAVLWAGLEQTFVIIMGCVPPLRALLRLEIPLFSSISSSLNSLIHRNRSSGSTRSGKQSPSVASYDASVGAHHNGEKNNTYNHGPGANYYPDSSEQSLGSGQHVRRTDQFTVSYDRAGALGSETV